MPELEMFPDRLLGGWFSMSNAADSVDMALALVSDVSRSVDDGEFALERSGYADAFTNSTVIQAIRGGPIGAVAVTYIEFAGDDQVQTVLGRTIIRDSSSASAFASSLEEAPRSFYGRTAISAGIDHAVKALATSGLDTARGVIDVCGDGTNNAGREIAEARDDAVKSGIVINGLAIINEHPVTWAYAHVQPPGSLTNYYRENVIGGAGSFVLEVRDFRSFGEAITRKLISEIAS